MLLDVVGDIDGDVVLRGGGDLMFDSKDLSVLVGKFTNSGLDRIDGCVIGDELVFDAFRGLLLFVFRFMSDVGFFSAFFYDYGCIGKWWLYWQSSLACFVV